ncbi:hypothetical protein FRC19_009808 [Serendipita sp. 401]|nr:hypothetical protein FRC19_009808 [Serendipita sp. 401]
MVPNSIRLFMEKNRDSEQKVKAQGELTSSRDERHGCLQHMGASVNPYVQHERRKNISFPLSPFPIHGPWPLSWTGHSGLQVDRPTDNLKSITRVSGSGREPVACDKDSCLQKIEPSRTGSIIQEYNTYLPRPNRRQRRQSHPPKR